MYKGIRSQILMSLALVLAFSSSVEAQAFGRVTVVVRNEQGQPLQGVEVTTTCDELPKFREVTKTNKKGKAVVSVTDATKVYNFHFTYEDFQPADLPIKPEIRGNITREVTLAEGQLVATDTGAVTFTPAERLFNEGVVALKDGDLAAAKAGFLAALEKNDDMAPALAALAGVYLEEEDYQAALAEVKRYMELEPDNPNGFFMLYDAHTALGNREEADAALKALKDTDQGGDTVALIYNAGVAAVKVGNYVTAKARFLEALELDSSLKEAVGALSVIFAREENHAKAAEYAEKHLAMEPGNQRSLRIRWDAYANLGDEEKADLAFRELAAADPKVLAVELYNKGNDLFESGNTPAAIAEFERVIEIDPENALAHYRLGVCHVGGGNSEQARHHLEKFIEMSPEDPEVATAKDMLGFLN